MQRLRSSAATRPDTDAVQAQVAKAKELVKAAKYVAIWAFIDG